MTVVLPNFQAEINKHTKMYRTRKAKENYPETAESPAKTKVTAETHLHVVGQDRPVLIYELVFVYM